MGQAQRAAVLRADHTQLQAVAVLQADHTLLQSEAVAAQAPGEAALRQGPTRLRAGVVQEAAIVAVLHPVDLLLLDLHLPDPVAVAAAAVDVLGDPQEVAGAN